MHRNWTKGPEIQTDALKYLAEEVWEAPVQAPGWAQLPVPQIGSRTQARALGRSQQGPAGPSPQFNSCLHRHPAQTCQAQGRLTGKPGSTQQVTKRVMGTHPSAERENPNPRGPGCERQVLPSLETTEPAPSGLAGVSPPLPSSGHPAPLFAFCLGFPAHFPRTSGLLTALQPPPPHTHASALAGTCTKNHNTGDTPDTGL